MSSSSASGGLPGGNPGGNPGGVPGGNPGGVPGGNPAGNPGGTESIDDLITEATIQLGTITDAFGKDGKNLTNVIDRNKSILADLEKINIIMADFDAQINILIEQLSNSKTEQEFDELSQNLQTAYTDLDTKIRTFLTNFNTLIPTLNVSRLDPNTSLQELVKATDIVKNIRDKAFAYIRKGPRFPATANAEFTNIKSLVNGIYTRDGNGFTFKNNSNDTRISFELNQGVLVPGTVNINNINNQIQQTPQGFTTTINGNPYFLVAYPFQNIPVLSNTNVNNPNPGGGSKRKRRRTRKNKRKSNAKKQKGGFGYNNKIPSSNKKKTSKRRTSGRTSGRTSSNTTSTSSSK